MKTIALVFLLFSISDAQNSYEVTPGVKGNQIVLQLSNTSASENVIDLNVKVTKRSDNIKFSQSEKRIENIEKGKEEEAVFEFAVSYNAKANATDTVEFLITNGKSVHQMKQFVLRYAAPTEYKLEQNFPNPFNPATVIRYQLPAKILATLKIFDVLGKEVSVLVNEENEAGFHQVEFNGAGLASGVYLYSLQAGSFIKTKKFILLK
ncbi:MAG: T9SS type A sorting domain-containing protein [Ignavibacteria bacterium]|jgi:hypothetical protein|nr:T9SS type A sorting domain-containing protein [Ignavibacteria bacterium]MDP3831896.1 T9SS type A sorting domain-containing protein [Ignavibacteriaceae bacterium]